MENPHILPCEISKSGLAFYFPADQRMCYSQFCVAVSGFKVLDPFCDPFFHKMYITPTLHVIGRTDIVVVEERSRQLVEVSANARVEEHDGGRVFYSYSGAQLRP